MDLQSKTQSNTGLGYQSLKNVLRGLDDELQICIQNCDECSQVCERVISHCVRTGGKHAEPSHLRLLRDCENICSVSSHFMLRNSDYHSQVCGVCAEICEACANDCDSFGDDDEMMQECASVCRRCADSCRKMASGHQNA
jgi:hypothetical protein